MGSYGKIKFKFYKAKRASALVAVCTTETQPPSDTQKEKADSRREVHALLVVATQSKLTYLQK